MNHLLPSWFWIIVFLLSIIFMLYLGANPSEITQWWHYLFIYNLSFGMLAVVLIMRNISYLKRQSSSGVLGSKLTFSFIKMVPLIAILPLVSFYIFSFNNIQGAIANILLFAEDLQRERQNKLDDIAKDLALIKLEQYQTTTQSILTTILQNNDYTSTDENYKPTMQSIVNYLINIGITCDIKLYSAKNELIAASSNTDLCPEQLITDKQFPNLPLYVSDVKKGQKFYKSKAIYNNDKDAVLRIATTFAMDRNSNHFFNKLDKSRKSQINLELNLSPLRKAFLVDMSSTLLLTILAVLMIVFKMINNLMRPLNAISNATKEVATGNYDVFITEKRSGDVKILIDLFNHMAKQVKTSQNDLETERIYLETILRYSYGVIALDEKYRIRFLNSEINHIFQIDDLSNSIHKDYLTLGKLNPHLAPLIKLIKQHFNSNTKQWQDTFELSLANKKNITLAVHGAILEANEQQILGFVIIIKDISELQAAQNKAAWAAVAMKMAHEIKNPLTPIQLSAERLRNKLLPQLSNNDASMLDKTTKTITEQVKSIDMMLSAFAQYAKTPVLKKDKQLLSSLINEVVQLYQWQKDINIKVNIAKGEPLLYLDSYSIKRALINLIKNAIEATIKIPTIITINLSFSTKNKSVILELLDNGTGVTDEIKKQIFKPNITTKKKGGGLGMSIVQSILNEHNASIKLDNYLVSGKVAGTRVKIVFQIEDNK